MPSACHQVFISPTVGMLTHDGMISRLRCFVVDNRPGQFKLMVGTDSRPQTFEPITLVTAIAITKRGNGGIYCIYRTPPQRFITLQKRILAETEQSVLVAGWLRDAALLQPLDLTLEIHIDIGDNGPTREFIRAMTSRVDANGYPAIIKPEALIASRVAHRHT